MDMEELFMMLAIMIGMSIVMFGIAMLIKKKRDAEDAAQPMRTGFAKLVDMQQILAGQIVFGEIWVLFELDNGDRMKLNAKAENSLVVGDTGMLTWQGRKILKFERNKTA